VSVLSGCIVNAEEFFNIPGAASNGPLATTVERVEKRILDQGGFVVQKDAQSITAIFGLGGAENHTERAWSLAVDIPNSESTKRVDGVAAVMPIPDWRFALEAGEILPVLISEGFAKRLSLAGACINNAVKLVLENLRFGSRACLSSAFYDACGTGIEVRPLDLLALPGERHRQEIYELLGGTGRLDEQRLAARDAFWKGVILYREGRFQEARSMFEAAQLPDAEDHPVSYYLALTLQRMGRASNSLASNQSTA
jgi:tetratricopeptide (TPR) repeat protein